MTEDEPTKSIKLSESIHTELKIEAARHKAKIPYFASELIEYGINAIRSGEFQIQPAAEPATTES